MINLALVGCGTMSEQFHLPVLAGHEGVRLAALVDRDELRVRELAGRYGVAAAYRDLADLPEGIDAALIATPPFHHAPGSIALMRRGIHVLVEKPMALRLAEAEEMCHVASEHGVVLSVGVYKRLLPVTALLRSLVESSEYGRPLRFSMEWGGIGGYASATLGLLRKEMSGGGVLMDLGAHVFDQLLEIFGGEIAIDEYRDDARGGIEADCDIKATFHRSTGPVSGSISLSRVRNLSSKLRIECERATLEAAINERFEVTIHPVGGERRSYCVRAVGPTDVSWYESYRAEVDDFLDSIVSKREPRLSGKSVLPTVRAVDECYARRCSLRLPWFDDMPPHRAPVSVANKPRRVLVTGAGGFIGGRAADILALRDGWQVRALVHNPGSASRLARLPVELIQGDLKSDDDVRRAVEGCDAVVHCAVGTAYGYPREIYSVTVDGTKRLAAAAQQAGVARFVHISSIGVHDPAHVGVIDERTPVGRPRSDWYGYTKVLAERQVQAEEARGLSSVILRPGCVYGPYGFTFVMNPLRALARGALVLQDSADTSANTVFVDNLVEAIVCALEASAEDVRGQCFAIGDGDGQTWGGYYDFFAAKMGTSVPRASGTASASEAPSPVREFVKGIAAPIVSSEAKDFAKRVLQSDPVGTLPRFLLERYPALERGARNLAGLNEPTVYRRDASTGPTDVIRITPRQAHISIEHARQHLRYEPPVSQQQALSLTWDWARYARII